MIQTKRVFHGSPEKLEKYNELCDVIAGCRKCPGLNRWNGDWNSSTLAVFGSGNLDAEIVFIGQSACKLCMKTGIPFTKGSGDFLDQCLESIGLTRKDVFITNVVKCHPPGNRPSKKEEIENCRPYLEQELSIIQPKLVVTLGRDALEWFKPVKSVMDESGKVHRTLLYTLYSLPHPVVVLRRPELRDRYMKMFSRIPYILKEVSG